MGFFKAAARRSKRGCGGELHRCNGGRERARVLNRDLGQGRIAFKWEEYSPGQAGIRFYVDGENLIATLPQWTIGSTCQITYENGDFYGNYNGVKKKLGSPTIKTKAVTGNGSFDAGGKVLFAGIQNAGLHIMTYAQKYGQGSYYSATCSYAGNMITYDQHAYGENTSGTDQYSMTIIYAVE